MNTDMTTSDYARKQPAGRHPFGPRPLGAIVPTVTKPAFRQQSATTAQLVADWPAIIGSTVGNVTSPRRLAAGTLTLGCQGPIALELQHCALQIIERVNQHLGRTAVTRLRFIQEAGQEAGQRAGQRASAAAPPRRQRLDPVEIAGFPPGPLRDALSTLGAAVKTDPA